MSSWDASFQWVHDLCEYQPAQTIIKFYNLNMRNTCRDVAIDVALPSRKCPHMLGVLRLSMTGMHPQWGNIVKLKWTKLEDL